MIDRPRTFSSSTVDAGTPLKASTTVEDGTPLEIHNHHQTDGKEDAVIHLIEDLTVELTVDDRTRISGNRSTPETETISNMAWKLEHHMNNHQPRRPVNIGFLNICLSTVLSMGPQPVCMFRLGFNERRWNTTKTVHNKVLGTWVDGPCALSKTVAKIV